MRSAFSDYYYDRFGNERTPEDDTDRAKIAVARDALVALTEQLREGDRLGVVLYSSDSAVAKPLRPVEATDMDAIRDPVREAVRAGGGTNLDAVLDDATELLAEYEDAPVRLREPDDRDHGRDTEPRQDGRRDSATDWRPAPSGTSTPPSSASASTSTPNWSTNSPRSAARTTTASTLPTSSIGR